MKHLLQMLFITAMTQVVPAQDNHLYSTYSSFSQLIKAREVTYLPIHRISDPGTSEHRSYSGFFFYQCLQFDTTGRYVLGMKVYFQNRPVQSADRAEVGLIDLQDGYRWTKIGHTTAWNWQQGARLQWRPKSDEVVWNDRSDDGKNYVCRVYNFRTGERRTLPRPIYDLSPDGKIALTHDFERMKHRGTDYVGIEDMYKNQYAPSQTGIWKMNMDTGRAELIMNLERMAGIAYPNGHPATGCLYFFREGWNPSGTRFIAFLKDPYPALCSAPAIGGETRLSKAFSMKPDGTDVRYLYDDPSHHSWQDDEYVLDFGTHRPPGGGPGLSGYFLFKDDGTGETKDILWVTDYNGHGTYITSPEGDWILSDTYGIDGYQYLFMYHRPTKLFVPLARLRNNAPQEGILRVDLHPRLSRNGRTVCIDSTYEDFGRQMYILDIGRILDNPPSHQATAPIK